MYRKKKEALPCNQRKCAPHSPHPFLKPQPQSALVEGSSALCHNTGYDTSHAHRCLECVMMSGTSRDTEESTRCGALLCVSGGIRHLPNWRINLCYFPCTAVFHNFDKWLSLVITAACWHSSQKNYTILYLLHYFMVSGWLVKLLIATGFASQTCASQHFIANLWSWMI